MNLWLMNCFLCDFMHIRQPMNHPVTSFGKNEDPRIVNQNKLPFSLGPPHFSWHLDYMNHPYAKPTSKLCRNFILPCNFTVYQTGKKAFNHMSKKGELKI